MKLTLLAATLAATMLFAGAANAMDCCKDCDCCKKEHEATKPGEPAPEAPAQQ
jgi:hypothetical protein